MAQEKCQTHPALLRREREPARGGQIGGLAVFGELSDYRDARLEQFFHGEQHVLRLGCAYEEKPRWRESEEIAAEPIGCACFERGVILLHPDDGAAREHGERKRKTGRRAVMEMTLRAELMHLAKRQSATERAIDEGQAERKKGP